ncbi:GntR family transcriptional regulator [Desulfuromonas versatilis]|uniref:GntR family transcriptional regulator n=1 Tax=Desulfuromonas versatilis TaxID=2802975 RepID=A0ABM8HX37_9BACT|nr:PLP-dependent aminotransferase family protein [Desulfuromonas versatilis]BCR05666.1 GntR family transcriptional regulator [Desulfuromonas versatilis]
MFTLNPGDPAPLYQQLYQQIRERILSGKLPAHSRLPSVRELAAELAVSRNTVEGAFQELLAEGYVYSRSRSGYFISALDPEAAPQALPKRPRDRRPLPGKAESCRFDFHPARLDPQSFPAALWRRCLLSALRAGSGDLAQYGDPQGEWGLRCNIQRYLERSRGVLCDPGQILVCAGLQQSLDIVAQLVRGLHLSVAVENPGYHLPRDIFRNHGFAVIPVEVGTAGLDLDALRASAGTIAYITPSHQLPLGHVMPVANRLKLIDWAEKGGNLVIEDDYDSELRYQGRPIPSLQGLRPQGNIVYLGTFSKVLSPALRLSYMVLPPGLLAAYRRLFRNYQPAVPLLEQRAMAAFMEQGHWERHVRRMRIFYKKKHDVMLRAIERHFGPRAKVVGQGAGLHVVLQLTDCLPGEAEILQRAGQEGIRILPLSDFYAAGEPCGITLLLGFGGLSAADIEQGIGLLARLCP